ncbi:MAG: signal transduction histidine kinase [Phenylobacterium sp.]|jgi:signal transduction histidine kinase
MKKIFKLLIISDTAADIATIATCLVDQTVELMTLPGTEFSPELIAQSDPDLLILDESTVDTSIQAALGRLKSTSVSQHIPVLVLTDNPHISQLNQLITLGGADWLNKPLHQPLLCKRIEQQMAIYNQNALAPDLLRQQLKMLELGHLVSLVGHEVASPIGNINTAVSFLFEATEKMRETFDEKKLASQDLDKYLKQMHRALGMCTKNCANAASIITSYRTVAGNQCLEPLKQFYLHRYLDDIVLTLKSTLKKLPHDIHIVIGESIEMTSFPGVFSQVMTGLIKKSLKYGFDDKVSGTIIISTAEAVDDNGQNRVIVNYIDDGKGLTAVQLDNLFNINTINETPQHQPEPNQKTKVSLTTAMLRDIVQDQLEGTLTVQSNEGQGVHVILDLPRNLSSTGTLNHDSLAL